MASPSSMATPLSSNSLQLPLSLPTKRFTESFLYNKFTTVSIFSSSKINTKSKSLKLTTIKYSSTQYRFRANLNQPLSYQSSSQEIDEGGKSKHRVLLNSLRVLEWDKLCDSVSSFAGTSLGRIASKEQLGSLDQTYEESLRLLRETNAAVEIRKFNNAIMDFSSIDVFMVRSAIDHAQRASPVTGQEAISVAGVLQFAEVLQSNIKAAIKENADLLDRFLPLADLVNLWGTLCKLEQLFHPKFWMDNL
ncbi:unnamed protein product [Amaranthus hypochondriacus]